MDPPRSRPPDRIPCLLNHRRLVPVGRDPRDGAPRAAGVLRRGRRRRVRDGDAEPADLPRVPRLHHRQVPGGPGAPAHLHRGPQGARRGRHAPPEGLRLPRRLRPHQLLGLLLVLGARVAAAGGGGRRGGARGAAGHAAAAASYFAEEKRGGAGGEKENGFRLPPLTSYSDVFGEWAPGKAPICGFCGEECNDEKVETLKVLPKLLVPKAVNIERYSS